MTAHNLSLVMNHHRQSILLAAAAWLLTLSLRKNHASIRFRLWLAASGKRLIPISLLIAGLGHAPSSVAQSPERMVFKVASIKLMDAASQTGGPLPRVPRVTPGGGIRSSIPISGLICWAYGIDKFQLSGGPPWIRSDRYAIEAEPEKPDDPTALSSEQRADRARERVKALLADRFHLDVRTETKEDEVYVLSVAKEGHKLTPSSESGGVRHGAGVIESPGAPISFLVVMLKPVLERWVLDETGLDGQFKFKLEYLPVDVERRALALSGKPVAADDPRPSIFTAIKSQLGLELQSRKGPLTTVVIERIERPTVNQ